MTDNAHPHITGDHANLAASCINRMGTGDHPAATAENLGYFDGAYVRRCVKKAVATGKMSPRGVQVAAEVLAAL